MAEGVTYADLRFVRNPPGNKAPKEGNGAEEEELTYENVQGSRSGGKEETPSTPKKDTESKPWVKGAALGALTTCLVLLAVAVGLGVQYGQVSGQLQRALQAHAAHSSAQEGSLEQKEDWLQQALAKLNFTQEALRKSQEATEKIQEQLQVTEEALRKANHSLEDLKQERDQMETELQQAWEDLASTQEALRRSQEAAEKTQEDLRMANLNLHSLEQEKDQAKEELRQANSCQNIGCCPYGWTLFRWKCLWVSQEKKYWQESREDCEAKSSQLLMPKEPRILQQIWGALGRPNDRDGYWIGLSKTNERQNTVLVWVDGSRYEGSEQLMQYESKKCIRVNQGRLEERWCKTDCGYICERAASPTTLRQAPRPPLGRKA
ncbi:B-cell differentiation antigen CD72 [Anolis carolinensis]|uniref:B-cell differentiation antigen CD72 n=1 Tax=Anolis carolinensis TaxID=28377 RepID=UPI002F2B2966